MQLRTLACLRVCVWGTLWIAVALVACSPASPTDGQKVEVEISEGPVDVRLDPRLAEAPPEIRRVWFEYGQVKGMAIVKGEAGPPGLIHFRSEAVARQALAQEWRELGLREMPPEDAYLDKLDRLSAENFTQEYVLAFLAEPGWTISDESFRSMRLAAFAKWAGQNLKGHEPQTLATVPRPVLAPATVAGSDVGRELLDSPDPLARCGDVETQMAAWAEQEKALEPVPIAARSRIEFFDAMMRPEVEVHLSMRGGTWVSPRVAQLFLLAARCATDTADYASAERLLIRLLLLNPVHETGGRELAQVLAAAQRWADAMAQAERTLAMTTDECHKAVLWRTKGFILGAKGGTDQAKRAYERALRLAPDDAEIKAALDGLGTAQYDLPRAKALLAWSRKACRAVRN